MKATLPFLVAGIAGLSSLHADVVYSNPMGYVSISCPPNSDTIVGLPLRQSADFSGALSDAPDTQTAPGSAILSLTGTPGLTLDAFAGTHYVKFKDTVPAAAGDGQWFAITANDGDTITVDLNGDAIDAISGAQLEVLKFWTLDELFPPAECTTSPSTTGNAIVASLQANPFGVRTQLLLPDFQTAGTNLAPTKTYFVHGGIWKEWGFSANEGTTQFWPDSYFIIRNPSTVTTATTYTISGEVEMGSLSIPLRTQSGQSQDNFICLPRAVDVTLNDLNLGGTSAFTTSTGTTPFGLRDQLIVFNNGQQGFNKSGSATYFYFNSAWRLWGDTGPDRGTTAIPAGSGFIVRKFQSGTGNTAIWDNAANY